MILLNYAHPLTSEQLDQLAALLGVTPKVRDIPVHIDRARPITEVARELVDAVEFSPAEWQTLPLIVNPPGLSPLALALIAEIHGRCGHFPAILNIRPVVEALPMRYEVSELIDLQALRDTARATRGTSS
jgi:hypothetical protein